MKELTLGYIAEHRARKWPDEVAVVDRSKEEPESRTFQSFNDRVDRLANSLVDRGFEQGDSVAIYMKNNVETLETVVAAMKLGALPVPVNHRFVGEEVKYVLQDSDATVCVVDAFGAEKIADVHDASDVPVETFISTDPRVSFAESFEGLISNASDDPVELVPDTTDEALIFYTSGTTGRPKGCIYTHYNFFRLLQDIAHEWEFIGPENRHLVVTPLFHNGGLNHFFYNSYAGGTTVLTADFDPREMLQIIEEERITSTFLVPTQIRMLLDVDDFEDYDVSSLSIFLTGGAPVGDELATRTMERLDTDVMVGFGQTEVLMLIRPPKYTFEKTESVGRSILSLETKIVDPEGEKLPPGEAGRIAYRGPTVFKEYLNMPEKNQEVFQDGWFVSEDLVRQDEDGYVYFLGRSDDMIITGGENVYPFEVEEVLHEHPDISEVAVVGVPDETWGERIKACVELYADATTSNDDVVSFVTDRLADYKKPREVEFYDELPKNPTGKVLKNELV